MNEGRIGKLLPWISTPLILFATFWLWKLVIAVFGVSPFVLPQPEDVGVALVNLLQSNDIWFHVRITLTETLTGFAIALTGGVLLGALLGRIVWLERALRPLIVASQVIPKVALIPLFVIWFGFGMSSKIIMASILAFFPIMLNVLLGVRSVDPGHRDVMRSLNTRWWQTFRCLELPSTLPYVFAGAEIAIVFSIIGAVVGEYLGGNAGLGYLVVTSLNSLQADQLFAVIVLLAALGFGLFFILQALKRVLIPWHESVISTDRLPA